MRKGWNAELSALSLPLFNVSLSLSPLRRHRGGGEERKEEEKYSSFGFDMNRIPRNAESTVNTLLKVVKFGVMTWPGLIFFFFLHFFMLLPTLFFGVGTRSLTPTQPIVMVIETTAFIASTPSSTPSSSWHSVASTKGAWYRRQNRIFWGALKVGGRERGKI